MKRQRIIVLVTVVLLVLGLWALLRCSSSQLSSGSKGADGYSSLGSGASFDSWQSGAPAGDKEKAIGEVVRAYQTPITFNGCVIDQFGTPVVGAIVTFAPIDSLVSNKTSYTGRSDENGMFSITNIMGIALSVGVRKEGYHLIDGKSSATFAYGIGADSYRKTPPTKDSPAVFVLHKMGKAEPIVHVGTRSYKVSKDGQPFEVSLGRGTKVPAGQGDIRFQRWANDKLKDPHGHFDWRLRISVPGGGLVERTGQFDFEAPEDGYEEVVEIDMPTSLGDEWSYTVNKNYFAKLGSGRYARLEVMIQAGHNTTPLVVTAYLNPKLGSRNLEYDPELKAVPVP